MFIDLTDRDRRAGSRCSSAASIGLSFLLLMVVFRSILVPLKAAVMNVLSIGAAYGVIVAVFQRGWGASLFGVHESLPIVSFIPMFMFAILFGLSMDYEVFLLSRIREEYLDEPRQHRVGRRRHHHHRTGHHVAPRSIMISVFLSFVLGDDPTVKMIGTRPGDRGLRRRDDHPHGARARRR